MRGDLQECGTRNVHRTLEAVSGQEDEYVKHVLHSVANIHDDSRPSRDAFECQQCGNQNHADYNAAKNVADVYLRREQQSSRGRGVSQYALKSGAVMPNGGYTPYPDRLEAESTDKP